METERLLPDDAGISRAAATLAAGQLVALPTETVYGLGADARSDMACARVFEAKGRPRFNPLIVHVADFDMARQYAQFDAVATRLADAFWPGPLTLVVPLAPDHGLSPLVSAGLETVAIRVPAHPVAQALLATFGGPIAAPSANPSGRISPTSVEHVISGLDGKIAAVLDGGPCEVGLESTILTNGPPVRMLRQGGLPQEQIEAILGVTVDKTGEGDPITAPGQLRSHYAPEAPVRLNATSAAPAEVLIGFGSIVGDLTLSTRGDLVEAAARLFDSLYQAQTLVQKTNADRIAVAPIPNQGLGRAINDRLQRAAAPRDT